MKTILVVDDEARIAQIARDYLERAGFAVLIASDGPMALQVTRADKPDLIVLDLGLPQLRPPRSHVWPRLLRAAEQSHTALIIVAPQRVAGSFAVLSLALQRRVPLWRRSLWTLFDGFETVVALVRNKLGAPGQEIVIRARESCSRTSLTDSTSSDPRSRDGIAPWSRL